MKSNALRFRRLIVAIQICRPIVGGQQYVQVTVTVEISACQPPPNFRGIKSSTDCIRYVLKLSAASIQEELRAFRVSGPPLNDPNGFAMLAIVCLKIKAPSL